LEQNKEMSKEDYEQQVKNLNYMIGSLRATIGENAGAYSMTRAQDQLTISSLAAENNNLQELVNVLTEETQNAQTAAKEAKEELERVKEELDKEKAKSAGPVKRQKEQREKK
jgi:predicted  nucleic acid-binding Zn-ribbon protein